MSINLKILVTCLVFLGIFLIFYSFYAFEEISAEDHTPLRRPFLMGILRRLLPKRRYVKLSEMIRREENYPLRHLGASTHEADITAQTILSEMIRREENYPLRHLGVSTHEADITAQTILSVGKNYRLNKTVVKTSTDALKRAIKVCEATSDHKMVPELLPKIRKAFENMAEFGVSVDEAFVKDSSDLLDRYNKLSEDLRNRTDEERAHDLIAQMQRTHAVPDLDSEVKL